MATTPNLGLNLLAAASLQKEVQLNLWANAIDAMAASAVLIGTLASRPAASWAGRLYFATDAGAGALYRDTGSAWVEILFSAKGGSVNLSGGAAPAAAAGPQAGTSPPVPVVIAGSNDQRGTITFGTGTSPAAGSQVNITFASAYTSLQVIMITPINNVLVDLHPTPGNIATTGFSLFVKSAPAASQGNGIYQFSYLVLS